MRKRKAGGTHSSGPARREGKLSAEEEQELFALSKRQPVEAATSGASPPAAAAKAEDSLMEAIRTLGRMPKETKTAPKDEQKLARRLREARRQGKLSKENEKELAAISERQAVEAESSDAPHPAAAGMPHCSLMDAIDSEPRDKKASSAPTKKRS